MRSLISMAVLAAAIAGAGPAQAAKFDIEYEASIQNVVTLGRMTLKGQVAPTGYNATATVQTAGLAALFDDTRITASTAGRTTPQGLSWLSYDVSHAYAKKFRKVSLRKSNGAVTANITPAYGDLGTPPATEAQKLGSRDPVSALVEMGRQVGASGKCGGRMPVFDGKGHYNLILSPKTTGAYAGGGYNGKAIVCWLQYQPVSGFKPMTPEERAKIPLATAWFSTPNAEKFSTLLRIEVPTPVGAGRIDVKKVAVS